MRTPANLGEACSRCSWVLSRLWFFRSVLTSYFTCSRFIHPGVSRCTMRHVWAAGILGLLLGIVGVIAAIPLNLGPIWYPIAIALTALPCAWLGGVLYLARHPER